MNDRIIGPVVIILLFLSLFTGCDDNEADLYDDECICITRCPRFSDYCEITCNHDFCYEDFE